MPARKAKPVVPVSCPINVRTWVLLSKRAEDLGVSVARYVEDHLVSFFSPKEVESIKEGFYNPG